MSIRKWITTLIYLPANAVLFGVCLIIALMVPGFRENLFISVPAAVVASFILTAPIAWLLAPTLRSEHIRERRKEHPEPK